MLQGLPGAAAHEDAEETALQAVFALIVIEAEILLRQGESDFPRLAGLQADTAVVLQLLHRAHQACRHVPDIELYDLGSRALADVFQRYGDLQVLPALLDLKVGVGKAGIAQTVSRGY